MNRTVVRFLAWSLTLAVATVLRSGAPISAASSYSALTDDGTQASYSVIATQDTAGLTFALIKYLNGTDTCWETRVARDSRLITDGGGGYCTGGPGDVEPGDYIDFSFGTQLLRLATTNPLADVGTDVPLYVSDISGWIDVPVEDVFIGWNNGLETKAAVSDQGFISVVPGRTTPRFAALIDANGRVMDLVVITSCDLVRDVVVDPLSCVGEPMSPASSLPPSGFQDAPAGVLPTSRP